MWTWMIVMLKRFACIHMEMSLLETGWQPRTVAAVFVNKETNSMQLFVLLVAFTELNEEH